MVSSHKWFVSIAVLAGLLSLSPLVISPVRAQGVGSTAEAAGITFETLSPEDLDGIQQESGYRVGVYVASVEPDTPGAAAGIKQYDIILIIGETGVDNAEAAAAAVKAASGTVEVMAYTSTDEGYASTTYSLNLSGGASGQPATSGPPVIGWQLQALDREALDKIEKVTGHGVGVLIAQVAPGSAAAQAGLQANDILLTVGKTGVDSPQAVDQALAGQSGAAHVLVMRPGTDKFEPYECDIALGAAGGGGLGGTALGGTSVDSSVTAYFDMLDFVRTQAWGRNVTTPTRERQRVSALLEQNWGEMDPKVQEAIQNMPQTWAAVRNAWAGLSDPKKAEQREYWRNQLLQPSQILPPLEDPEKFRGKNDTVAFEYPAEWVQEQTEQEGSQYLFVAPPKTQISSLDQVVNASSSPAGALFVITPITDEMKQLNTYLEGARWVAQQYVTGGASGMKEIGTLDMGDSGAIITLRGNLPGQREEKFFWVGAVRYGSDYVFIGRMGGPTAQAETLVPAFYNMITTMQLNPPAGTSGGGTSAEGAAAVDLAASVIGNAVAATNW